MLPPRRLLALLLTAFAVVLSSLPAGWSAAANASASASNSASTSASTSAAEDEPSLPHPAHGQQAINLLGDQLDEAATLNGWTSAQLRHVLATDSTAWVDGNGRVYYIDPPPAPARAGSVSEPQGVAPYPLENTFLLHSKPGSNLTLLIDFDGATVSGTQWNQAPPAGNGVPNGDYPAWTVDGDATTFNAAEREAIQTIWQRVAEDYAPFNIDVTTQDPGLAGIEKANSGDTVYGTRALVTPSDTAQTAICGGPTCGGVAYVGVFGLTGSSYQPAWVFPQSLSNDAKNIAEAVSHEVGHNFSLQHDGTTVGQTLAPCVGATGYYCGHDMWAPIMGVGYYRPVAQWSKGEYANASQTVQDDVALIAARAPYRTDEAGGTTATAASGLPTVGYISTAADTDTFLLGSCSGTVTLSATGAAPNPNLDIQLELLNSAGTVVATNNPASAFVDRDNATGLTASISTGVAAGSYYARVDGVGNGTGATGYTDYGSIGAYTSALTGCTAATAPSAPTNLVVSPAANGQSATVTWAAPASNGGSALTGYTLTRTGGTPVDLGLVGTHNWTGLTPGSTYTFTVAAKNAVGTGPAASEAVAMPVPPTAPTAPTNLQVNPAANGQSATVTWTAPASNGGSALTGYTVSRTGASSEDQSTLSKTWTGLTPGSTYTFTVAAKNAVGTGPAASDTVAMPGPPTAPSVPTNLQVAPAANGQSATVTWTAPASDGGSAITGYTVSRTGAASEDQVALSKAWTGLTPGTTYLFSVTATNAVGTGPAASLSVTLPAAPSSPTGLVVTPAANGQSATVTWSPPASNGGSPVTGYTLTRTGGTPVNLGVVGTHTWSGLTPGTTYTFTAAAKNAVGPGTQASVSASLPTTPGAPVIGKAKSGKAGGKKTAKISWSAPATTGGSALTGYKVLVFKKGKLVKTFSVAAAVRSYTAKLKAGKYQFAVVALNAAGAGPHSALSKKATAQ